MNYIILDVDTGIDDALAIAYAVQSPEIKILGITTTFGNATVEETTKNTLQVLELLGADEIPVIVGVDRTFADLEPREKTTWIHGEYGLGMTCLPTPKKSVLPMTAHDFIISKVREYPHQVTIVTVATQTNLALAIQKDPELINLVRDVAVMGGAVTVPGNITPYAEANIYTDAEAADYVFSSGIPIMLVGLDVTLKTLLHRGNLDEWRRMNTPVSNFLADICDFYMGAYRVTHGVQGCPLHDPLAIGVVIDKSFVKSVPMQVRVKTEGEAKGQTVGTAVAGICNVQVCTEVQSDKFVSHFLERIERACKPVMAIE